MRIYVAAGTLALLLTCGSALAHKDRVEHARTLAIDFRTGEKVVFEITNSAMASVTVHIGSSKYSVPSDVCARLRPQEIHFNTVKLLWNDRIRRRPKPTISTFSSRWSSKQQTLR